MLAAEAVGDSEPIAVVHVYTSWSQPAGIATVIPVSSSLATRLTRVQ
jgi:hypothetical protein|eukprot:COSAG06_NODE_7446_length_2501_cov_6.443381_1_plen_47_part_00